MSSAIYWPFSLDFNVLSTIRHERSMLYMQVYVLLYGGEYQSSGGAPLLTWINLEATWMNNHMPS